MMILSCTKMLLHSFKEWIIKILAILHNFPFSFIKEIVMSLLLSYLISLTIYNKVLFFKEVIRVTKNASATTKLNMNCSISTNMLSNISLLSLLLYHTILMLILFLLTLLLLIKWAIIKLLKRIIVVHFFNYNFIIIKIIINLIYTMLSIMSSLLLFTFSVFTSFISFIHSSSFLIIVFLPLSCSFLCLS